VTDSAHVLSTRLNELASALHSAGAPPALAAGLLELAAVATLKAVELESLVLQRNVPPQAVPSPVGVPDAEPLARPGLREAA
jgi:hypothetical protein